MSGQIAMIIDTAASVTPHIRNGKLRGIAITGKRRWPDLPEVLTFAEGGLTDYDASSWYAIHAPAGTPKDVIGKLNAELARIVKLPEVSERLRLMSAEAVGGTPAELDTFVRSEFAKWGKVIKSLNLRVD
jgi:tripartite-type tricarboxylate transporter receptor subunit TctC